jgi:hypothetical protein
MDTSAAIDQGIYDATAFAKAFGVNRALNAWTFVPKGISDARLQFMPHRAGKAWIGTTGHEDFQSALLALDSWETLVPKHPQLELVKIPNALMLVPDDQPQAADAAISAFVKRVGSH